MTHHGRGLRRLLKDDELLDEVVSDWKSSKLDPRRRAILRYAEKLTKAPATMVQDDIEALRVAGLEDADILQLAEVVSYYAYVNRIADGLGVMLESPDQADVSDEDSGS